MKYRKLVYILFIMLFIVGCQSEVSKANSVEEYIPSHLMNAEVTADIMTLEMDPDTLEKVGSIGQRMREHLANNMDWYLKYVEEHAEKKSFPYHPNFGVTKEEYEFVLNAIDQSELVNTKDGKLKFKKKSNHEVEIFSSESIKLLNYVVIDTEKNTVKTSLGECEYFGEIIASPEQKLTGPWHGKRWMLKKDGLIYTFSLGKLETGNKSIIDISVKGKHKGEIINKEEALEFSSVS
ncbi:hypothetical protein [Bacillus paramycoides]|uniref:Uncharacterized protein n=1 Tax=Bacillus paramycoides TaxID=2026194 RepID=A0A1J9VHW3_9BACI|nr:hypothetical protein [Bacillus paramycoides]OJD81227.1 hypothetical protein BAU28_27010 [Bacillus paramycoides]